MALRLILCVLELPRKACNIYIRLRKFAFTNRRFPMFLYLFFFRCFRFYSTVLHILQKKRFFFPSDLKSRSISKISFFSRFCSLSNRWKKIRFFSPIRRLHKTVYFLQNSDRRVIFFVLQLLFKSRFLFFDLLIWYRCEMSAGKNVSIHSFRML